jgi:hypothetical protein
MNEYDRRTRWSVRRVANHDGNEGLGAALTERSQPRAGHHGVQFERASGGRYRVPHSLTGSRELRCGVLGGERIAALSAGLTVLADLSSNRGES